jgi:HK97 family phage portal protein
MGKRNYIQRVYDTLLNKRETVTFPDWYPKFNGISPIDGITVNEQTVLGLSAFWAGCVLKCNSLSSPTIKILTQNDSNGEDLVMGHPVYQLLNVKPNNFMTPFSWRSAMAYNMIVHGNGYSIIVRDNRGIAVELLPVMGDMVDVKKVEVDNSEVVIYEIKLKDGGKKIQVSQKDMIHWLGLTRNGYVGMSPITYLNQTLGIALAADKEASNTYEQGSNLSGVLSVEGKIDTEAIKRIRKAWNDNYNGSKAKYGTAVLDNGAKFNAVSMTPQDSQLLESRKYSGVQIAQIMGIPPHMIAILDRATNNNIEHLSIEFVRYGLNPDSIKLEQEITLKLLTEAEQKNTRVEFDFTEMLRGDTEALIAKLKGLYDMGALTPNEARRELGKNPIENHDSTYTQFNTTKSEINEAFYQAQIDSNNSKNDTNE